MFYRPGAADIMNKMFVRNENLLIDKQADY